MTDYIIQSSSVWPTNSIIGSTTEALLREQTREERSIDVLEEMTEVVVSIMVCRVVVFLKGCGGLIRLTSFIVNPDVLKWMLKHGVPAVLESEPDLLRWDMVSIDHYLCLVFPTHH